MYQSRNGITGRGDCEVMICNVAIIGAGSIGNHLAFSCRKLNWNVDVFDSDIKALDRFKDDIYPSRYGIFDKEINLKEMNEFRKSNKNSYDVILIGTPPDTHYSVLVEAVALKPRVIMIEKPLTGPDSNQISNIKEIFDSNPEIVFLCGYNHKVNIATTTAEQLINTFMKDGFISLQVHWQESWEGILKAHPWLENHNSSYLGYFERGGGALFEHSHGLDMWLHFSRILELGKVDSVSAIATFEKDEKGNPQYDSSIVLELETTLGFKGKITQDVTTLPSKKQVEVFTASHRITIGFNDHILGDFVLLNEINSGKEIFNLSAQKTRPFDFDLEIREIERILHALQEHKFVSSPLSGVLGLETAQIATASMNSALTGTKIPT